MTYSSEVETMIESRYNPISIKNDTVCQETLTGERALFRAENLDIFDSVFKDGESPLKESNNILLESCEFHYKYPIWYSKNIKVKNCTWQEMGRSGVWYTKHMLVEDSMIWAPKNFRRCDDIILRNVSFSDAEETFWMCNDIRLENVTAKGQQFAMGSKDITLKHVKINGDYAFMNAENIDANEIAINGNYAFDGAKNVTIRNSRLLTKDCFWNCENVTVYDSFISGEYLSWNTKNLTLVNCTIESNQGLDYIEGLTMINCEVVNTKLAFEYSTDMDVEITNHIESILNPGSGVIRARSIGEQILEEDNCDISKTEIIVEKEIL